MTGNSSSVETEGTNNANTLLSRIIFWIVLVLFVVSGVTWIFYLPYDEDALYRAIPANAFIVSEHDNLSERWQQIVGNNALKKSINLFGDNSLAVDNLARNKSIKWVCNHFAFKKTLAAFVMELGGSSQEHGGEAWIFSTWAGGNVQYLKRGLLTRAIPELKKERLEDGHYIWTLAKEYIDVGNLSLSLAVYDGVLVGCLSEDPRAVRYLLYRMRGRIMQPAKHFNSESELFPRAVTTDRVWISKWLLRECTDYNDIWIGLSKISSTELSGKVYIENLLPDGFVVAKDNTVLKISADISDILEYKPELLSISSFKDLAFSADLPIIKSFVHAVKPYSESFADNAPVFLGLFGGDASGRIMGLRVPTVIIGVKAKEPEAIIANIDTILDDMNSRSGWGLIPGRMGVGASARIGISSTRGGIYNSLKVEQRPAIKIVGNWLMLASNANALDRVLSASKTGSDAPSWPVWIPEGANGVGSSYLWSDLRRAGKSVRNVLAVWSLSLSVSGGKNKVVKKKMINKAREIIAVIQELGEGTVWVKPSDGGVLVDFHIAVSKPLQYSAR